MYRNQIYGTFADRGVKDQIKRDRDLRIEYVGPSVGFLTPINDGGKEIR